MLVILEDAINVRASPCSQEWQTIKVYSLLLPRHACPALLQFPAFFDFSCGWMTKFLPKRYRQKKWVPLLGLNIKKLACLLLQAPFLLSIRWNLAIVATQLMTVCPKTGQNTVRKTCPWSDHVEQSHYQTGLFILKLLGGKK